MEFSSSPVENYENENIRPALDRRRRIGSFRQCHSQERSASAKIDFSSNDYLGLAQSSRQRRKVDDAYRKLPSGLLGSTGSRLLTGDSDYAQSLERTLAKWHKRQSALICNSGYDANLSVMSCLSLNSTVIIDELCHNSIQTGIRLGKDCTVRKFRHNDHESLERILVEEKTTAREKQIIIVVESIYSMDGDSAPLKEIFDVALTHNSCVIVDEAHGTGVMGKNGLGLLEECGLENHPSLLCSVHTFGKAAGCHGAIICSSSLVRDFLCNYARPIIYSTSLPLHSLVCINCSYESMTGIYGSQLRQKLRRRVELFKQLFNHHILNQIGCRSNRLSQPCSISLVPSESPVHALIIPGNTRCVMFCNILRAKSKGSIQLYPIRSPTVTKGQERVRIILHSHNTNDQVTYFVFLIKSALIEMGIIKGITGQTTTPSDDRNILSRL